VSCDRRLGSGYASEAMHIAIGCDHAGWPLKEGVADLLRRAGHQVVDVGAHVFDPEDDYPDYAYAVAELVATGRCARGVVICGSGVGAAVVANKVPGVRAAVCHDTFSARQGVEDDDVNVLCLGARVVGPGLAGDIVRAWLEARFSGENRHARRLAKVLEIEARYARKPEQSRGD